jgi:hypothetical protein
VLVMVDNTSGVVSFCSLDKISLSELKIKELGLVYKNNKSIVKFGIVSVVSMIVDVSKD